jgi:hypothetical protein
MPESIGTGLDEIAFAKRMPIKIIIKIKGLTFYPR